MYTYVYVHTYIYTHTHVYLRLFHENCELKSKRATYLQIGHISSIYLT